MILPLLNVAPRVRHGKVFMAILQAELRRLQQREPITFSLLSLDPADGLQTTKAFLYERGFVGLAVHMPDGTIQRWPNVDLLATVATPASHGWGAAYEAPDGSALCYTDVVALLQAEPDHDLFDGGDLLAGWQAAISNGITKMELTSLRDGKLLFTIGRPEVLG